MKRQVHQCPSLHPVDDLLSDDNEALPALLCMLVASFRELGNLHRKFSYALHGIRRQP